LYIARISVMKKAPLFLTVVAIVLTRSFMAIGQDCDALIQQRPVPEANSFIHATPYYTMHTSVGSVTFNALTADGAVAIVFIVGDAREKCVDERSNIHIRFNDGEDIAMTNAAGANCESKFAIYFSQELGNMALLELFRNKKIRFVKLWMSNRRWLRVNFVDGMAYNLKRSMNCLASQIGAPVTASPARVTSSMLDYKDSITPERISAPQFKGGEKALRTYFGRHMRRRAIVDRGTAVVSFMVDTEGSIRDINVVMGVSERVDNEARRLVSTLPKWQPGLKNGIPVSARVQVKIPF
jgi:TonB family protein